MFYVEGFWKNCKTYPLNGYYMQPKAVRWQSKPSCENVACRASTTLGLVSQARES